MEGVAMSHSHVAILGSGMAGMGAAHALRAAGVAGRIFDKNRYPGGHTASHARDGFIFDEGPHVSFTRNEKIREIFALTVGGRYETINAHVDNHFDGRWVRHPVITNLYGLPEELVVACIRDFVESRRQPPEVRNYEDWLVASYGRAYAEYFPMRYTRKYHTTEARNLSTDWVGPRLYQASLDEVLRGALSPHTPNIHYVQDYRYPTHGGFAAFLRELQAASDIVLEHEVVEVDPQARLLRFAGGRSAEYRRLISSLPLPELVGMIRSVPRGVRDAVDRLACTALVLVNLGVDRADISASSWTYFYEEDLPFSRVSFPRNMSPHVVPAGAGSIQAEVYFSRKYRPFTGSPQDWIEPVIAGLRRCGLLRDDDRILLRDAMLIPYANIIFDLDRVPALAIVHGYLDELGIRYCGRYGDWGYLWTDEAFASGEGAAQRVLQDLAT
jgi:protoporphyrinogen oxidase